MGTQILNVLVSVIVTILLAYHPVESLFPTSTGEKVILGFVTFLFWTSFELLSYAKRLSEREDRHAEIWSISTDFERILNNIRKHYHDISKHFYGKNDL